MDMKPPNMERPLAVEALAPGYERVHAEAVARIRKLAPEDLDRTVYIRQEAFVVVEALNRSVAHTAYHVGQIVFIGKHLKGAEWKSLSIPKGQSKMAGQEVEKLRREREK